MLNKHPALQRMLREKIAPDGFILKFYCYSGIPPSYLINVKVMSRISASSYM